MKFLVTGTGSGLGKHLFEIFGGISITRQNSQEIEKIKEEGIDVIIHAAFNSSKDVNSSNFYSYLEDNIFLTRKLLKIPHKKFIFISSVDVYSKNGKKYNGEEVIDINQVEGIYALTKLISESLVKNQSANYLILRCSSMLGKYSRKNIILKIIEENHPILTLSSQSQINCILHTNISDFIKIALQKDLQGIYNLASSENIAISQIAYLLKKEVQFGNYVYNVGNIDNTKASEILPAFKKTSQLVITDFLNLKNG